jgi:type I restriction enzyme S subunit
VITGRYGTLGEVFYVEEDFWPLNTTLYVEDFKRNDPKFVAYFLRELSLEAHNDKSSVPGLNRNDLHRLIVRVPELAEQRAIASVLGALDDKIELNRRMNETLDAVARGIFKSWFLDFDPVRAKTDGKRPLGMHDTTAALFPSCLTNSELGEIPEGWEVALLPRLIDVNPTRSLPKGDIAPYLDMANMPTRGHAPDEVIERPFGSGMRFTNGDTLVARITPCLENGKTAFVDFLRDGQVGWGSTEYIVLRPKPPLPEEFAYCLARSEGFRDFAIQSMTGSSGRQRVPAESLGHFQLAVPPKSLAESFSRLVKPLFARAGAAVRESRTLAALRDVLLPKLISGEMRVKGVERSLKPSYA